MWLTKSQPRLSPPIGDIYANESKYSSTNIVTRDNYYYNGKSERDVYFALVAGTLMFLDSEFMLVDVWLSVCLICIAKQWFLHALLKTRRYGRDLIRMEMLVIEKGLGFVFVVIAGDEE